MTSTLIALLSVFVGIIAANLMGFFYKKYSFSLIGNTLVGVFGSIFFVKAFGRLGFDPWTIMQDGTFHAHLFIINVLVSMFGGIIGLVLLKTILLKLNVKVH